MAKNAASNSKPTTPTFNLLAELRDSRLALDLTRPKLARQIGCKPNAIRLIEAGKGRAEIMIRMMNHLKVDLIGIAPGTLLHDRLRATRELKRRWTVEKLAEKTGLPAKAIVDLERGMGKASDLLLVLRTLAPRFNRLGGKGGKGGDKDSRFTDELTVEALELSFGAIDFDPCAHSQSHVKPASGCYFELGQDGLTTPWAGDFVFMNPPFTKLADWTNRALEQWKAREITILACLIPTRTDSLFFMEALLGEASVFFFGDRLKFVKPDGSIEASKITTMLVVFGSHARQRAKFAALQKGVWVEISKDDGTKPKLCEAADRAPSTNMPQTENIRTSRPSSSSLA